MGAMFTILFPNGFPKQFGRYSSQSSMSHLDLYQSESPRSEVRLRGTVKRCRSCWRDDLHIAVRFSPFVFGFLLVISFGLILLIRPSRCVCCGTMRVF